MYPALTGSVEKYTMFWVIIFWRGYQLDFGKIIISAIQMEIYSTRLMQLHLVIARLNRPCRSNL